ncbi:unnamed protein product, partial [Ectocarpus sp. 4 AP-2014]
GRGRTNAERPQDAEREEYVKLEENQWPQIKTWFGMRDDFPVDRLYTRKTGSRTISYVAPATKQYLLDAPAGSRLQMVHTGVKVFERNSQARCAIEFRVCQEGLGVVLPYMTKRVTRRASAEDISRALDGIAVPVSSLSPPVVADLEGQEEGIFVFVHTVKDTGKVFTACVWKGRADHISSMINKDLLTGMRIEMKSLGVYVPKAEEKEAAESPKKAEEPSGDLPPNAESAAESVSPPSVPTSAAGSTEAAATSTTPVEPKNSTE